MIRINHNPSKPAEPESPKMKSLAARVLETYTSFSGIDISAMFDRTILSTLEAISGKREVDCFGIIRHNNANGTGVQLTREKVPQYSFGSTNPQTIQKEPETKNPCFTLFDRDAFYSLFIDESHFYYKGMRETKL